MFHICRTFRRHFSIRKVKLCFGQRKYKQNFTTQGRKEGRKEWPTDRPSEWIRARSLNFYFAFCKIVVIMLRFGSKESSLIFSYSYRYFLQAKPWIAMLSVIILFFLGTGSSKLVTKYFEQIAAVLIPCAWVEVIESHQTALLYLLLMLHIFSPNLAIIDY